MIVIFILGILLLAVGVALLFQALFAPNEAQTLGQIESYGFAAEAQRTPGGPRGVDAPRSIDGFAAQLGGLLQTVVGVGEQGIRRDLLSAGMYDADPLTIVGYRVMIAAGLVVFWLWLAAVQGWAFFLILIGAIII